MTTTGRSGSLAKLTVVLAFTLGLFASLARGFTVWEKVQAARDNQAKAQIHLKEVVLPAALEAKLMRLAGNKMVHPDPDVDLVALFNSVRSQLAPLEQIQLAAWLTARAARNAADDAVARAEKEYYLEMLKKDQAMKTAEAEYDAEKKFLEQEKAAIQSMPINDAYLDRVSRLIERLKKSYEKMNGDLAPYVDGFGDARRFVTDKEERLKKIAALEAEIARRRRQGAPGGAGDPVAAAAAVKPADQQANSANPHPNAPGPLGDTFVLDGAVEITPVRGKLTSATASGFAYEIEKGGKKLKAQVVISKAPPGRIRNNQNVQLQMTASGDPGAPIHATWGTDHVGTWLIWDNVCSNIPNFKGGANANQGSATLDYFFNSSYDTAAISMSGSEYDTRDGTQVRITWKYKKVK